VRKRAVDGAVEGWRVRDALRAHMSPDIFMYFLKYGSCPAETKPNTAPFIRNLAKLCPAIQKVD
jgi:hypothetical protein